MKTKLSLVLVALATLFLGTVTQAAANYVRVLKNPGELVALNPFSVVGATNVVFIQSLSSLFQYVNTAIDTTNTTIAFKPLNFNGRWLKVWSSQAGSTNAVQLSILQCTLPSSSPARFYTNGVTNLKLLRFATNEVCYYQVTLPRDYGSLPSLKVYYSTSSATSGNASFSVSIWKMSPGDFVDADTESYDVANVASKAVPGTANFPDVLVVPLTNSDAMVANDTVAIKIRNVSNSSLDDLLVRGDFVLEYVRQ